MARLTHEGTEAHWLPACADITAPTSAEITAGDDLTGQLPADGIGSTNTANNASQAMLRDDFVAEEPGTWGRAFTLTFTRDDSGTDTIFTLFGVKNSGFLLISRFGAPDVGNEVEVYPASNHVAAPLATAENEYQKFEVAIAVTDTPELEATVAA